jgi:hypothetical protein
VGATARGVKPILCDGMMAARAGLKIFVEMRMITELQRLPTKKST